MNWFQRYGISGMYFVALIIMWVFAFTYTYGEESLWSNYDFVKIIGGIAVFVSLPLGYIVSIFAQWLLYYVFGLPGIYKNVIRISLKLKHDALVNQEESEAETAICIIPRLNKSRYSKIDTDLFKWISDTLTKRWDVLAINQILIVATLIAPLLAAVGVYAVSPLISFNPSDNLCQALFIISGLIIFCLSLNISALKKQLIDMYCLSYEKCPGLLEGIDVALKDSGETKKDTKRVAYAIIYLASAVVLFIIGWLFGSWLNSSVWIIALSYSLILTLVFIGLILRDKIRYDSKSQNNENSGDTKGVSKPQT